VEGATTRARIKHIRFLRRLLLPLVLGAIVFVAGQAGRAAGFAAAAAALAFVGIVFLVIPRMAHRAFERGDHRRAAVLYRILRVFVVEPASRGALDVSLAGCLLARGDWDGALGALGRVDTAQLNLSARAAWYNNRAYACARGDRDRAAALELVDEAVKLRPDVPGFRHTRGVVLLELGRIDDAIRELDGVWARLAGEEAPPLLEAERCYDLGVAWSRKGEREYARDYFARAQTVAPLSTWASKARDQATG
jgi:tetratricopeptide (TPR) repeat protein